MTDDRSGGMTVEEFEQLFEELKNWFRWAPRRRARTVNLIGTPRGGGDIGARQRTVSLSLPVNATAGPDNPVLAIHYTPIRHDNVIGRGEGGSPPTSSGSTPIPGRT